MIKKSHALIAFAVSVSPFASASAEIRLIPVTVTPYRDARDTDATRPNGYCVDAITDDLSIGSVVNSTARLFKDGQETSTFHYGDLWNAPIEDRRVSKARDLEGREFNVPAQYARVHFCAEMDLASRRPIRFEIRNSDRVASVTLRKPRQLKPETFQIDALVYTGWKTGELDVAGSDEFCFKAIGRPFDMPTETTVEGSVASSVSFGEGELAIWGKQEFIDRSATYTDLNGKTVRVGPHVAVQFCDRARKDAFKPLASGSLRMDLDIEYQDNSRAPQHLGPAKRGSYLIQSSFLKPLIRSTARFECGFLSIIPNVPGWPNSGYRHFVGGGFSTWQESGVSVLKTYQESYYAGYRFELALPDSAATAPGSSALKLTTYDVYTDQVLSEKTVTVNDGASVSMTDLLPPRTRELRSGESLNFFCMVRRPTAP